MSCRAVEASRRLLENAKAAGAVRKDTEIGDISRLLEAAPVGRPGWGTSEAASSAGGTWDEIGARYRRKQASWA